MSIKKYGYIKAFDDGSGDKIILSASARLFVLYKDICGTDLLADFMEMQESIVALEQECCKHLAKEMDGSMADLSKRAKAKYDKMSVSDLEKFCKAKKIKASPFDNLAFLSRLIFVMFCNGLTEQDRQEALAIKKKE
ncbi:MAG: hypothetical protein FWD76_02735 [Firmicutes bacterium]|nr:hypothetical protein [Bacillota bacterium]